MKQNLVILLFFGWMVALLSFPASAAGSVEEQVKRLAQRYDQVEDNLTGGFVMPVETITVTASRRGSTAGQSK